VKDLKGRIVLGLMVGLVVLAGLVFPTSAALADQVTISGETTFVSIVSIGNSPSNWTINGIDGNGLMDYDTRYWANPTGASGDETVPSAIVVDGDCYFTVSSSSNVPLDLYVNVAHFTGDGDTMTNSNDKTTNGANAFAAAAYCTGMTYADAPTAQVSGSAAMVSNWEGPTLKWGLYIETQSGAWTWRDAKNQTTSATITAMEH
jgi:hypothetical protein